MPLLEDVYSPVADPTNPNRSDLNKRIKLTEDGSYGFLPARLVLQLSQGSMDDKALNRASRMLARSFDLNPAWILKPFHGTVQGPGYVVGGDAIGALKDPVTGGPITLDTARRFLRPYEPELIRKMLESAVQQTPSQLIADPDARTKAFTPGIAGADPKKVAAVVKALAPIRGTAIDFSSALGAALTVSRDERIKPADIAGLFAHNVEVAARSSLPPLMQISAAQHATAFGIHMRTVSDVASAAIPELSAVVKSGEELSNFQATQMQKARVVAKKGGTGGEFAASADVSGLEGSSASIAQGEFGQAITQAAGIGTPDFLKALTQQTDDYVKAAEEINTGVKVPFSDSFVGRGVGKLLDYTFRPFDAAYSLIVNEIGPVPWSDAAKSGNLDTSIGNEFRDARDIILGRTTAAEELQKIGYPVWATAIGEFAAGFWLDPFQLALKGWSSYKALHTLNGLVESGRAGEWSSKVTALLDGSVTRIGDLRNVTAAEYLVREMDRTKNANQFFGRAVDNFRTWFSADGLDSLTAARMHTFNTAAREAGISFTDRVAGVRSVFAAGLGLYQPELGTLARDIEEFARVRSAKAADAIATEARQLSIPGSMGIERFQPLREVNQEAAQAVGVLSDTALDLLANGPRMVEIPHFASVMGRVPEFVRAGADSELGRMLSSAGQYLPSRVGSEFTLNIEAPDVVKDFERGLTVSQVHTADEVATARVEFSRAVDPLNPYREAATREVIAKWNKATLTKINARYGLDEALSERIIGDMENHLSRSAKESMIFSVATDHPLESTVRLNKQRLEDISASLTGELTDVERSKLVTEQRKLTAFNARAEKNFDITVGTTPILPSQLRNDFAMLDPTLYKAGIAETIGTMKKWDRAIRGHFMELAPARPAIIPLRKAIDRTLDLVIRDLFLSVWKPLAVLRPAYILRVVGLEEQGRFLATSGIARRMTAGKWGASLAEKIGAADTRYIPTGVRVTEQAGQRANEIEDALLYLSDPAVMLERGFAGADRDLGTTLAQVVRDGGVLTPQMREAALKLVTKYKAELSGIGIDAEKLGVRGSAAKAATAARARQTHIDDGDLAFPVPGLQPNDPLANNNANRLILASDDASTSLLKRVDRFKGRWVAIQRGEGKTDDFLAAWHHALSAQFGRDPYGNRILDDIARGVSEEDSVAAQMKWLTTKGGEGPRYAARLMQGPFTVEELEVQVRKGIRYARDLTGNAKLTAVASAARDNVLALQSLRDIPEATRPLVVHGPDVANTVLAHAGAIGRLRDVMGHAILQAPTNALSRQPYFKSWYDRMYSALVEEARAGGVEITDDLLAGYRATARKFALERVDRIMFNFARNSRLDDMTRNMFVFLQPYLEFPTVWARIIRENPAFVGTAIRFGRMGLQSGFIRKDSDTGELVVPLSWWAGAAPLLAAVTGGHLDGKGPGGGWSLSAPLTSFNLFANSTFTIPTGASVAGDIPLPLPSLNPPFQWAMQQMFLHHGDNLSASTQARLSSWLFQYGAIGHENAAGFLPAYLRHGLEALFPDWFANTTNFNATHFLQLQQAMGLKPNTELALNQSREFAGLRAFFGLVFPASPQIQFPQQDYEDLYRSLTAPVEEGGLGYIAGRDEFLKRYPGLSLITISRTMWNAEDPNDPSRSPTSIPASKAVQQLLSTRGAKKFAEQHPQWVWAIIPHEMQNAEFDPGIFFAQIAAGQRKVLTPTEFLGQADAQQGWDQYFIESDRWTAEQESLAHRNIGESDISFQAAKDAHDQNIAEIQAEHPTWNTAYLTFTRENVDPKVMAEARNLAADPMFMRTDVGKGLADYLKLRDSIKHDLVDSNITSLNSATAQDLGLTKRYEDGVAAISEQYPDFATAYRLFFSGDLRASVKTYGDTLIDALPANARDTITAWESQYEKLKDAPDIAGTEQERNAAYAAIRSYVNQAYTSFPKSQNPMILRWESWRPDQKQSYLVSLAGRSYGFYSRFDKETILGERTDKTTEALWSQYDDLRQQITAQEAADPNFSSTRAYAVLDAWVRKNAVANPRFGEQVLHANQWGYAWGKALGLTDRAGQPVLFDTSSSGTYWTAFLDAAREVQAVADHYQLHGTASFDPRERIVYDTLRSKLAAYAVSLGEQNLAFKRQWAWLEKANGPDPAIGAFMPDTYFAIGAIPASAGP